jgi:hypothetical protein
MQDFERQVEELSSRVSALMREKANLESRNSLLERVVQLKDATEVTAPQVGLSTHEIGAPGMALLRMPLQGNGLAPPLCSLGPQFHRHPGRPEVVCLMPYLDAGLSAHVS